MSLAARWLVRFHAAGQEHPCNGIARTEDGGKTWKIAHRECARASDNLEGSWVEKRAVDGGHNIWFDSPYSLGVAPRDLITILQSLKAAGALQAEIEVF